MSNAIGKVGQTAKIAAGLFWADYAVLGAQVQELRPPGSIGYTVEGELG